MGSAKVTTARPQIPMENPDKKSIKTLLKSLFHKDKKKEKKTDEKKNNEQVSEVIKIEPPKPIEVADILESLKTLEIAKKSVKEERKTEEEDDFSNFSFKKVEDEKERMVSQSSEDSGFSEKECDRVVEQLDSLKIEDKEECKESRRKKQTVVIIRTPIRTKVTNTSGSRPYPSQESEHYRQISQINKQTLSGGQVIVNATPTVDNYSEVDLAFKHVEKTSKDSQKEHDDYWQIIQEVIHEDTAQKPEYESILTPESNAEVTNETEDILSEFIKDQSVQETYAMINFMPNEVESNPIEEFNSGAHLTETTLELTNFLDYGEEEWAALSMGKAVSPNDSHMFLTPPRSVNVPSPMSESQASFYPSPSDYTFSPERSSPIYNSDYEKYQDISQFDDIPSCIIKSVEQDGLEEPKPRERTNSISSMTMKQFKDMQKEIALNFSKMNCCQTNKKTCKEILQEHMLKLKMPERKNLCFKVSKLDLKTAYGVLHHILLSVCRSQQPGEEHLQYALFGLVCERVLSQQPKLFLDDFGLNLIKSAALRCPGQPFLTRYLVQCVRTALQVDSTPVAGKDCVFHEVDALGDNLVIACARGGDSYASVLHELLRENSPPLFRLHHVNSDGCTALHVACQSHSLASPRLHTVHVLLEHAHADLWKGDVKGGDTPLHMAVNSVNCDLQLIMVMFKHVDRKLWKKLAHCQNLSSVTPLEYARSATKSTTRQNYPPEVLDFLKKCR